MIGHMPRALLPRCFYVLLDNNDMFILVILRSIQAALEERPQIPPPRRMPLSACNFCDESVQVTTHDAEVVVLGQNWPDIMLKYELE